jgi:hypothetical protein
MRKTVVVLALSDALDFESGANSIAFRRSIRISHPVVLDQPLCFGGAPDTLPISIRTCSTPLGSL